MFEGVAYGRSADAPGIQANAAHFDGIGTEEILLVVVRITVVVQGVSGNRLPRAHCLGGSEPCACEWQIVVSVHRVRKVLYRIASGRLDFSW